jgi:hypothetical protein
MGKMVGCPTKRDKGMKECYITKKEGIMISAHSTLVINRHKIIPCTNLGQNRK